MKLGEKITLGGTLTEKYITSDYYKAKSIIYNRDFVDLITLIRKKISLVNINSEDFKYTDSKNGRIISKLVGLYRIDNFIKRNLFNIVVNNVILSKEISLELECWGFSYQSPGERFISPVDYPFTSQDIIEYYEPKTPEIRLVIKEETSKKRVKDWVDENWDEIQEYMEDLKPKTFYISTRDLYIVKLGRVDGEYFSQIPDILFHTKALDYKEDEEGNINEEQVKKAYYRAIYKINPLVVKK